MTTTCNCADDRRLTLFGRWARWYRQRRCSAGRHVELTFYRFCRDPHTYYMFRGCVHCDWEVYAHHIYATGDYVAGHPTGPFRGSIEDYNNARAKLPTL